MKWNWPLKDSKVHYRAPLLNVCQSAVIPSVVWTVWCLCWGKTVVQLAAYVSTRAVSVGIEEAQRGKGACHTWPSEFNPSDTHDERRGQLPQIVLWPPVCIVTTHPREIFWRCNKKCSKNFACVWGFYLPVCICATYVLVPMMVRREYQVP